MYNEWTSSEAYDNAAGTLTLNNYGTYSGLQSATHTLTAGTLITNNYGEYISVSVVSAGTSTAYGLYIGSVSGADTNYGIYDASGANWVLDADSQKIIIGEGQDFEQYWDATNAIINTTAGELRLYDNAGYGNLKTADTNVTNNLFVGGNITSYGADLAETFNSDDSLEVGDVVVINLEDSNYDKKVTKNQEAYSRLVVGVVSEYPSLTMGQADVPIALAGVTKVKVTKDNGSIKKGDLLTPSNKPGYAMKCNEIEKCTGAIIGKALESSEDEGIIMALIALQ